MGTFWQAVPQSTVYPRWNFHFHFDHTKRGSMIHGLQSKPNKTKPELEFSFSFWSHSNLSRGQLAGWPVVLRLFWYYSGVWKLLNVQLAQMFDPRDRSWCLFFFFTKNFTLIDQVWPHFLFYVSTTWCQRDAPRGTAKLSTIFCISNSHTFCAFHTFYTFHTFHNFHTWYFHHT